MRSIRIVFNVAVIAVVLAAAWLLVAPTARLAGDMRYLLGRIDANDLTAREIAVYEGEQGSDTALGAWRALDLIAPALENAPPRGLRIAFVTGGADERSLRGLRIMLHRFAPRTWGVPMPLSRLETWLTQLIETGQSPLLGWLLDTQVFLFHDVQPEDVERVQALARKGLGADVLIPGVQSPGTAAGRVHQVLVLKPLAERIRANDLPVAHLRSLLR
ncbi:MAG: hypothetical protein CMJ83_22090 [Planctomycetes bacterium]|nr:hypothetical protein [Planctomycetota bacterium]